MTHLVKDPRPIVAFVVIDGGPHGRIPVEGAVGPCAVLAVDSLEAPSEPAEFADSVRDLVWNLPVRVDGPVVHLGAGPDGHACDTIAGWPFQAAVVQAIVDRWPGARWSAAACGPGSGIAVAELDGRKVGVVVGVRR